jgi:hypothetical protein
MQLRKSTLRHTPNTSTHRAVLSLPRNLSFDKAEVYETVSNMTAVVSSNISTQPCEGAAVLVDPNAKPRGADCVVDAFIANVNSGRVRSDVINDAGILKYPAVLF